MIEKVNLLTLIKLDPVARFNLVKVLIQLLNTSNTSNMAISFAKTNR
jgi:hypothetical protein